MKRNTQAKLHCEICDQETIDGIEMLGRIVCPACVARSGWRVIAAASSYQRFHALADPRLHGAPSLGAGDW